MMVGGLLEFFLGNTFPAVVFFSFGAFWLSFGGTLIPQFNAFGAYAPADATSAAAGLAAQGFNASFGKTKLQYSLALSKLMTTRRFLLVVDDAPVCRLLSLRFEDQHCLCHHLPDLDHYARARDRCLLGVGFGLRRKCCDGCETTGRKLSIYFQASKTFPLTRV
jgi:hypothetical protein